MHRLRRPPPAELTPVTEATAAPGDCSCAPARALSHDTREGDRMMAEHVADTILGIVPAAA